MFTVNTDNQFKRVLSLKQLTIYGMVMMAPLAPFQVYGLVAKTSFNMVALVYLIGAVLMFFTAMSYAQMSKAFPYAGSVYNYVQKGLNPHIGFVSGWILLSDYILAPALVCVFAGMWMSSLVPAIPPLVWAFIFIIINTFINIIGIEMNAKVNQWLFWLQIASLIAFVLLAVKFVFIDGHGAGGFSLTPLFQPEHVDFRFAAAAVSIIVLGFIGFDGISTLAEEAKDPEKNVGKATVLSLVITAILFLLQSYMAGLVHPNAQNLDEGMALFDIVREVGGYSLYVALIIINVLAVGIAVTLNVQSAVSRIIFAMGRDNFLPGSAFLGRLHPKFKTPVYATLLSALVSALVAAFVPLNSIVMLVNFGAITSFSILNFTVFIYFYIKQKQRDLKSTIFYFLFPIIGCCVCLYVWTGFEKLTYIVGFSWLLIGVVIGFVKSKGYRIAGPNLEDI
jgi:amino acid transporter